MRQCQAIRRDKLTEDDNPVFLLKSMRQEYLENTISLGRFCFNHPKIFNEWEKQDAAQYDKWDSHAAFRITRAVANPNVDKDTGIPDLKTGMQLKAEGEIHYQSELISHTPVCCFRCIRRKEIEVVDGEMYFSLGKTANRIETEFGHDSYIIVPIKPFLELIESKGYNFCGMEVVYCDALNDNPFQPLFGMEKMMAEQIFRKDKRFEWQNEYRICLKPTNESPVFINIGSIESIAVYGQMKSLETKRCIYRCDQSESEN